MRGKECTLILCFCFMYISVIKGQDLQNNMAAINVKPFVALQCRMSFSPPSKDVDLYFRRLRFGFKGNVSSKVKYCIQLSGDNFGSKVKSYNGLKIYVAYLQATPFKNKDLLHIYTGYLYSSLTQEAFTSPFSISSLDKPGSLKKYQAIVAQKGDGILPGAFMQWNLINGNNTIGIRAGAFNLESKDNVPISSVMFNGHLQYSFSQKPNITKYALTEYQKDQDWLFAVGIGISEKSLMEEKIQNEIPPQQHSVTAMGIDGRIQYNGVLLSAESYGFETRYAGNNFKVQRSSFRLSYFKESFFEGVVQPLVMFDYYSAIGTYLDNSSESCKALEFGVNYYYLEKSRYGLFYSSSLDDKLDMISFLWQIKL